MSIQIQIWNSSQYMYICQKMTKKSPENEILEKGNK